MLSDVWITTGGTTNNNLAQYIGEAVHASFEQQGRYGMYVIGFVSSGQIADPNNQEPLGEILKQSVNNSKVDQQP